MRVKFPSPGREYAIVFADAEADTTIPVAILGFEDKQNLYLTGEGAWKAHYLPAFMRRYPFILATDSEGKKFSWCIEAGFAGYSQEGDGRPLFDEGGERTEYLEGVLKFLREYQVQHQRTRAFIQKFDTLERLEPMQAKRRPQDRRKALALRLPGRQPGQTQRTVGECHPRSVQDRGARAYLRSPSVSR